jgi:hypothetical protein
MTKTLYWERAAPPSIINHGYDDKAMRALEEYFGPLPITFKRDDIKVLSAMQTAGGGRPLGDIIKLIEEHREVRIWWDEFDYRRVFAGSAATMD